VIVLNGPKTADVQDSTHLAGPIALQYGSGVVKFRKVQIKAVVRRLVSRTRCRAALRCTAAGPT
jgi:hypothetical protein